MNNYNPNIHHRKSIRLKGYDYSQAGAYFITICCQDMQCRFGEIVGAGLASAQINLNEIGTIAYNEWAKLPERFPNFELDVFQIMPNHMHGIIVLHNVGAGFTPAPNTTNTTTVGVGFTPTLNENEQPQINNGEPVGAGFTPALNNTNNQNGQPQGLPLQNDVGDIDRATARVAPTNATVGNIIGAYKSLVTNECIDICNQQNKRLGKLWQRNYHENIIRDEKSYLKISEYIINNPKSWKVDKFYS